MTDHKEAKILAEHYAVYSDERGRMSVCLVGLMSEIERLKSELKKVKAELNLPRHIEEMHHKSHEE